MNQAGLSHQDAIGNSRIESESHLQPHGPQENPVFSRKHRTYEGRRNVVPGAATTVEAVQAFRGMRGGSQSKLIGGSDGNLWVVKFQNNPQHSRVLANEFVASRIAGSIGLSVPCTCVIRVSPWLVENNPILRIELPKARSEPCASGLQFASQFVDGALFDVVPDNRLSELCNLAEFTGALAFDKWTCNTDGRQAVFRRTAKQRRYRAVFIDQGHCFNSEHWSFPDAPLRGVFARTCVYSNVTGWKDFEPWLSQIEEFDCGELWRIVKSTPSEWYGGDNRSLEILMNKLLRRRSQIRELIDLCRRSDRKPFPNWTRCSMPMSAATQLRLAQANHNRESEAN